MWFKGVMVQLKLAVRLGNVVLMVLGLESLKILEWVGNEFFLYGFRGPLRPENTWPCWDNFKKKAPRRQKALRSHHIILWKWGKHGLQWRPSGGWWCPSHETSSKETCKQRVEQMWYIQFGAFTSPSVMLFWSSTPFLWPIIPCWNRNVRPLSLCVRSTLTCYYCYTRVTNKRLSWVADESLDFWTGLELLKTIETLKF